MDKNKNKDDYISESSVSSIVFQILAIAASIILYSKAEDEFVVLASCICLILSILTLTMQIKIYNYAKHGDNVDNIANKNLDDTLSTYIILVLIVIVIIIISGIMKMYYLR